MRLTVNLSGHLKSLYPDLEQVMEIELEQPVTVRDLAIRLGISPWIVMSASIDDQLRDVDFLLQEDQTKVTLIGPMAGG